MTQTAVKPFITTLDEPHYIKSFGSFTVKKLHEDIAESWNKNSCFICYFWYNFD